MLGDDKVIRLPNPVMGAEDFSYVIEQVPGTMMFLGGTPPDRDPATAAPNHSNRVVFDEDGDGRRHRALRRRGPPPPQRPEPEALRAEPVSDG